MTVPDCLARDPWVPARERLVIEVGLEEEPPVQFDPTWTDLGEGFDDFEKVYAAVPPAERQKRILEALARREISPPHAARRLSDETLRLAALRLPPKVVAHYRFIEVALARDASVGQKLLTTVYDRQPLRGIEIMMAIDSPAIARFLFNRTFHPDPVTVRECRKSFLEWASVYTRSAAKTLLPLAFGSDGKTRARAARLLLALRDAGHRTAIDAVAIELGPAVAEEVAAFLSPAPFPPKAPKMPAWWKPDSLPRPHLADGSPLDDDALARLGQIASLLPLERARLALAEVAGACDGRTLDAFAWALVDAWLVSGGDAKGRWTLHAAGALGDESAARRLVEHARNMTEAGKHKPAAAALEALSRIDSDVALLQLDTLSRAKKSTLKKRAVAALEAYRVENALTPDELEDRLVPDLGLDRGGTRVLDFGARAFKVAFDQHLVPYVIDEAGQAHPRLPRAKGADDAALAARSAQLFQDLKSDTKTVGPRVARRLERAMARSRRWSRSDWERFFLRHPLTVSLARRLVWTAHDASGVLRATFRIAEDGRLADVEDDALTLSDELPSIGLAHDLDLGGELSSQWRRLFADYELLQPFLQLGRPITAPTTAERESDRLSRFANAQVAGSRFFGLRHRGWDFADYDIGKVVGEDVVAQLETKPGLRFLAARPEDQVLGDIYLRSNAGKRTFAELSPIVFSELVFDVSSLVG